MLYELCTLEHAFLADNLLGLVYKIVKGKYDAIPEEYSSDLKDLVDAILNKDDTKRPTVEDILQSSFLKEKMEAFINKKGHIGKTTLKAKALPVITKQRELTEEEKEEEMMKDLTPAQRMKLRKELRNKREADEMKKAIQKNMSSYKTAKERLHNEFYNSKDDNQLKRELSEPTEDHNPVDTKGGRYDQFKLDPNSKTDFSCNDR